MEISDAIARPTPMAAALDGLRNAQDKAQVASELVAGGDLDPAVILSLSQASTEFAASAKVMSTSNDMTQKLLDTLV